jgi:hypothetical protein
MSIDVDTMVEKPERRTGGIGLISNNLIEGRTTTYDGGLMVEFHLIAPIAFGFRYLASMLQNDSKEILHSATFHFALYF